MGNPSVISLFTHAPGQDYRVATTEPWNLLVNTIRSLSKLSSSLLPLSWVHTLHALFYNSGMSLGSPFHPMPQFKPE